MRIRDRLTWVLSITSLLSITILGVLVYTSTARFHELEFFTRLEERVAITELIFLENDKELESAVRDRFLQTLDEEKEFAISLNPSGLDSLRNMFPDGFLEEIQEERKVRFWQDDRQGVGVHYSLPKGEYVVIVTAVDTFGRRKLIFLWRILLIGGLLSISLVVLIDRISLTRALQPLENTIRRASNINAERLNLRLQVENPNDEIGKVARAFNRMLDRLQNSFEAQRLFVRNASHEIQNPLTAIRGEAEVLLQKTRSTEEYKSSLKNILTSSTRLQVLIEQLLDLEKTDALSFIPDPNAFPIDECLLECTESFPSGRIKLEFDLDESPHLIYGQRELMQTALKNIIDNALKYSDPHPITLTFSRNDDKQVIMVSDEGIGIPENDLKSIFQPFFRSENARTHNGHGIGLALVKKIIELHNGEIEYSSIVGKGTVVVIHLPVYHQGIYQIL